MSELHVKYLLIGAGRASSMAAAEIRRIDPEGSMLMVGQEIYRPYERPALSSGYLLGAAKRENLFTQSDNWWSDNHIRLQTGRRAANLFPNRHAVTLDDGQTVTYDRLLLATGASARHLKCPGADLPNIFYLHTIADADRLHHGIDQALREGRAHDKGRGHAAVIGAGILGVELAGTLTQLGLSVDLLASSEQLWPKFAGETVARFALHHLESCGVRVHLRTSPLRLEGDGRVQRVVVPDRPPIDCDLVVAAIGIAPNKDLVRGTAIKAEHAILVDSRCLTSEPDIYAAGDCAAIFDPLFGKYRLLDHWDSATTMGRIAGLNIAGQTTEYNEVNSFSTRAMGIEVKVWGAPRSVTRGIVRGSVQTHEPDFIEIGISDDDRVAQIVAVNHATEDDLLHKLVATRLGVTGKETQLRDPAIPLQQLL